jgi:hypothetical protein
MELLCPKYHERHFLCCKWQVTPNELQLYDAKNSPTVSGVSMSSLVPFSSVSAWLGGAAIGVAPAAVVRADAMAPRLGGRGPAAGREGERAGAAF